MEGTPNEVLPREFLCCPLCGEEFQEPKYLPCLHSFCKACIHGHINNTSDNNGCFTCPVCATPSESNTSSLPDNTFAKRLSCPVTVQRERDKTCGQCKTPGSRTEAKIHCFNCDEFLCQECAMRHLHQEETASHKTQKIENYVESDTNTSPSPNTSTLPQCCTFYDALDIGSTYCVDCETCLCVDCHTNFHSEHRCAELSSITENFENKIKTPLQDLKKDMHKLHVALVSLENARKHTSQQQEEAKATVKQRTRVLCSLIQEYEQVLVMELDKRHVENMTAIQEREGQIQRHIESINAVADLTEKLLVFGLEEEKVLMRRQIGRRVRELCELELPARHIRLTHNTFSEPPVAVETICELFGLLKKDSARQTGKRASLVASQSIDLGVLGRKDTRQSVSSTDELTDLEEYEGEDLDMLHSSRGAEVLSSAPPMLPGPEDKMLRNNSVPSPLPGIEDKMLRNNSVPPPLPGIEDKMLRNHSVPPRFPVTDDNRLRNHSVLSPSKLDVNGTLQAASCTQSSTIYEDVPCLNLEVAKRAMIFPDTIAGDCIKGVGVNSHGDIIVGTASPFEGSKVFILEKHGIVRGQIQVEKNWLIHSIAADGKVSLVMPRGENRYKVKVMSGENNMDVLVDVHIESFGLNSVTATKRGTLLVAANRYATTNPVLGRSPKYGGNITMYDKDGKLLRVITNETFTNLEINLFDRPHIVTTDHLGNFFVADPGRHSITGFSPDGAFLFEHGNTDAEEELYQGPDAICTDRKGNVIVFDKKDGRIDILNYEGQLQRCYFPSEHIRFVCTTPDKALMLVNSVGEMKFFDYL